MRAFWATAQHGSLTSAAKALSLTQPTLSRQITALEQELDVMLFERVGRGLQLTEAGGQILAHVKEMGAAAERVALSAAGQSQSVDGLVRITASENMTTRYLPEALTVIRSRAPRLRVEIVATNDISDLKRREADIAIRHVRPDQPDLIAKLIREAKGYFYASDSYLATRKIPKTAADLKHHDFVAYGDPQTMVDYLAAINLPVALENIPYGSTSIAAAWALARAGLGIAVMEDRVAETAPEMARVLPDQPPVTFPIWLVTHREIHTSPRIRLVFDTLAEVLA